MVLPNKSFTVMVAGSVVGSCRLKVPLVGLGVMVKVGVVVAFATPNVQPG